MITILKGCWRSNFLRFAFILIITGFISFGCSSGGGDDNSTPTGTGGTPAPAGTIDNTKFYGAYSLTITVGDCDPETLSLIIGNDERQTDTEGYIYLPEAESSYALSDGTITVSGNTVFIDQIESDGDVTDIEVVFNDDYSAFTITGTMTDTDPEECSGAATGSATLIDRTPIAVTDRYIQYRTYSDGQRYSTWIELSNDGNLVEESDITSISLIKKDSGLISNSYNFYSSPGYYFGEYNETTGVLDFSNTLFDYAGYTLDLTMNPPEGEYIFEIKTSDGYSMYNEVYFPGEVKLPVPLVASMSSIWNDDGSLTLSWDNPAGDYGQLRIVFYQKGGRELMFIKIYAASNVEQITIPSEWIQKIDDIKDPDKGIGWQVQTRKYYDNANYARGLSDVKPIPSP